VAIARHVTAIAGPHRNTGRNALVRTQLPKTPAITTGSFLRQRWRSSLGQVKQMESGAISSLGNANDENKLFHPVMRGRNHLDGGMPGEE
jgi:hypothetical protein